MDEQLAASDCWAGVLPLATTIGAPQPCPRLTEGIAVPANVSGYRRPGW